MEGPNFDPVEDEEVRVGFRPGIFKITKVRPPDEEHPNQNLHTPQNIFGTVDLQQRGNGFILPAIPWHLLNYVDETRFVRRTIDWLKTSPDGRKYPDYIVDYEVNDGEDHEGNPSIFVRFFVDPDYFYENGHASEEKVRALNEFLDSVRNELLSLELDRWISVRAGEARRALDVAS
jgi:hypothetical protein